MKLIIFGAPGAGKDTFSEKINKDLGLYHFNMGQELRSACNNKNETNEKLHEFMGKGELVPDKLIYEIIIEKLKDKSDFILNGFPRSIAQCLWMESTLKTKIDAFIDLQVDKDVLISRLIERGRSDDTENIIANRLKVFQEKTRPVWQYLQTRIKHIKINGNGSIEEVYASIIDNLENL